MAVDVDIIPYLISNFVWNHWSQLCISIFLAAKPILELCYNILGPSEPKESIEECEKLVVYDDFLINLD